MKDILLAGLTTESNGQPLTSGGMIYIDTRKRKNIIPNITIDVAIPTTFVNTEMQLYKGEEKEDGSINWTTSDTLPSSFQTALLQEGRQLFQQNCRTCHAINKNLTGPAIRGFIYKGPWKERQNLYAWVHNPATFLQKDPYVQALRRQFGSVMPAFPQLTNQQIDAIVAYIQNEENNPSADLFIADFDNNQSNSSNPTSPSFNQLCPDTVYFSNESPAIDTLPLEPVDTAILITDAAMENIERNAESMQGLRSGFTDQYSIGVYQFQFERLAGIILMRK